LGSKTNREKRIEKVLLLERVTILRHIKDYAEQNKQFGKISSPSLSTYKRDDEEYPKLKEIIH
jgi:hypothetical protein